MGYSSQTGYIGLRQYAGGATPPADLGTAGAVFRLRSGSLGTNRDLLIPDAEIGGVRDIPDAYLGTASWTGDLSLYVRLKEIGSLIYGAFGTDVITGTLATGGFTHTITPVDANLPAYWVEEQISSTYERFSYQDVVVNTLHLEATPSAYLAGTVGLISKKQIAGVTATAGLAGLVDTSPMIVGTNITVQYNSVTLPAKSFSFDVNNNVETDDFRLGSFFLGDQTAKRREVTAGFTIRPQDSTLWRQAVYGTTTATQSGGLATKAPLVITMTSYEDMPGVTGPTAKYSLTLTMPNVILSPFNITPSGDDVIEHDVTAQAVRPLNGTPICTAVLKTTKATLA